MKIEESLATLEEQLTVAGKDAKATVALLKKAQAAAKIGHIRDLKKALADSQVAAQRLLQAVQFAANSWTFETESHLANGSYLEELLLEANRAGLRLVQRDGRLSCFPMLLSISSKDAAVLVNRKPEYRIRPRELVRQLVQRQKRPQRTNEQRLLETFWEAYRYLASANGLWTIDTRGVGPVMNLIDIYELLTILPGAEREYAKEEFIRDIWLLDSKPDLCTKDGRSFSLPASTGSKNARIRLSIVDEVGNERVYVGIRFDKG